MSYNEGTTMKKVSAAWVVAVFVMGVVVGALGGALIVILEVQRYEADAIAFAVADSTFSTVPTLIAFDEESADKRLALIESAARSQLTAGIVVMHVSMSMVSDEKKDQLQEILRSIASKRERLKVGRFSDPPLDHIEEILATYAD